MTKIIKILKFNIKSYSTIFLFMENNLFITFQFLKIRIHEIYTSVTSDGGRNTTQRMALVEQQRTGGNVDRYTR
jgi:hypothetical protein